jgi:hypothetical protein
MKFHAGVTVDKTLLSRAHTFLKSLEKFLDLHFWWMSRQTKYSLLAYCLYVRQKLGDDVRIPHSNSQNLF